MSTYNGEKYLAEQIDTILAQEGVHVELFVRDDGSTDGTKDILNEYAGRYENVHINFGSNLGCGKSFLTELNNAPEVEYYAFSDQDDRWLERKLIAAVTAIKQQEYVHGKNSPILYYSNLYTTDEKLNIVRKSQQDKRIMSLQSVTLHRSISGCTMVMNAKLRDFTALEVIGEELTNVLWHDSIIYSMIHIIADGVVIFDSEAYILYRQHGSNLSGGSPISKFSRFKKEWRGLIHSMRNEAEASKIFLEHWRDEYSSEAKTFLTTVAGYKDSMLCRLKLLLSPELRTGDWRLTLYEKLKILLGLF